MQPYVTNKDIADILFEVAELLEIDGADRFRVDAYRNAALTVMNTSEALALKLERDEDLAKLANIGLDIAEKIDEIVRTGELSMLQELEQTMSPQLVELSHIPGLGAKRVKTLQAFIRPLSINRIRQAALAGELVRLPGIGRKTQDAINRHFARG